ncbi:MAG: tetratricopeptide repeat protein, partial [Bacteroidales bacterium]|nr:tetratricopeptide repeat protein [Bacteroidales bacterium]
NRQALKSRGKANYSLQNYNQAISDFSKLIGNDPMDADAFFKRAESKFQLGDFAEAVKDYQSVINIEEDFPKVYLGIGFAAYRSGDLKSACEYWTESLDRGDLEATSKIEKYCNK